MSLTVLDFRRCQKCHQYKGAESFRKKGSSFCSDCVGQRGKIDFIRRAIDSERINKKRLEDEAKTCPTAFTVDAELFLRSKLFDKRERMGEGLVREDYKVGDKKNNPNHRKRKANKEG